jgi:hypothetical protein
MLKREDYRSYKIIYSGFPAMPGIDRIPLKILVGAGRFERPTPCAQGSFRPSLKMPCFQVFTFQ